MGSARLRGIRNQNHHFWRDFGGQSEALPKDLTIPTLRGFLRVRLKSKARFWREIFLGSRAELYNTCPPARARVKILRFPKSQTPFKYLFHQFTPKLRLLLLS